MKKLSKVLVLVLSAIMVLAMSASVFAADVTVTPPDKTQADSSNTYSIYKVFDAVGSDAGVSYKLLSGKTTAPEGFTVDDAGNVYLGTVADTATQAEGEIAVKIGGATKYLTPQTTDLTQTQIDAIKAYIDAQGITALDTKTVTGTTPAEFGDLETGYYYISTTTGTAVVIKTNNDEVDVKDKNTVPELDKKATGEVVLDEAGKQALAQVGTSVNYEATITVGKGAEGYVFHDKMSDGLSYNDDVKVFIGSDEVAAANYDKTTATGDTITLTFDDEYMATLEEGTKLVVKYSATVTSAALNVNAAKNTATLDYGDENGSNSTPPSEVEVYNATITVDKKDGDGEALAGAGFVLKNAEGKYYKLANNVVSWVDTEAEATELTTVVTEGVAQVSFTGLADGTYTIHEKTVPEGYNAAADSTITVAHNAEPTNLSQKAEVVNNAGAVLPGTGGIGTTIFYILGTLLVVGCGIVLVSRKRMENNK